MLSTIARAAILAGVLAACLAGCGKEEPAAKTKAEYQAEAAQQIDEGNFLSELDSLEESIGQDVE
jgi:hypothetical protein